MKMERMITGSVITSTFRHLVEVNFLVILFSCIFLTLCLPLIYNLFQDTDTVKECKMLSSCQPICLKPTAPAWPQNSLYWMVSLGWKMHMSGSLCHSASCTWLLWWETVGLSTSLAMRRLCTGPCSTSWPYSPSLMLPGVLPLCPICCVYSGSISRRLDLIPALSRCSLSTCWLEWSLVCSCSWPWTAM